MLGHSFLETKLVDQLPLLEHTTAFTSRTGVIVFGTYKQHPIVTKILEGPEAIAEMRVITVLKSRKHVIPQLFGWYQVDNKELRDKMPELSHRSAKLFGIVSERAPYGSLEDFLRKNSLDSENLHEIAFSLCSALAHVHKKAIIHGDLATRNLLVFKAESKQGYYVKICDFGLSTPLYNSDYVSVADKEILKSKPIALAWSAPELFDKDKRKWSLAIDIWSLGVTCNHTFLCLFCFFVVCFYLFFPIPLFY